VDAMVTAEHTSLRCSLAEFQLGNGELSTRDLLGYYGLQDE
jgi:hypothetical protein